MTWDMTIAAEIEKESAAKPNRVAFFRTTFFWPLTLVIPSEVQATRAVLQSEVQKLLISNVWKKTPLVDHAGVIGEDNQARRHAYAERAYFHDFVQSFLFPNEKSADPMIMLKREDVKTLHVSLSGSPRFDLDVDKLCLYVAPVGVAILVLEVSCKQADLSLKNVQDFNNRMRRTHSPFLVKGKNEGPEVPEVPEVPAWEVVQLVGMNGDQDNQIHFTEFKAPQENAHELEIVPFDHWLALLNPNQKSPVKMRESPNKNFWKAREPWWRHVSDDRLPILSAIRMRDIEAFHSISEGNWMRTCFVDGAGDDAYPYQSQFLKRQWLRHAYDRHNYNASESSEASTRFLMCAYAMTAVGYDHDKNFFKDTIQTHMRRHYFQMMLIIQLELATMLSFSSRITHVVERFSGTALCGKNGRQRESKLQRDMQKIERDFLNYTHRFKFTGISNQQQAVEMYDQLRDVTALDRLYEDIKNELTTATAFLFNVQNERRAEAAEGLNLIAAIGVGLSLGIGLAGLPDSQGNSLISTLAIFTTAPANLPAAILACFGITTGFVAILVQGTDMLRERAMVLSKAATPIGLVALLMFALSFLSTMFGVPRYSEKVAEAAVPAQPATQPAQQIPTPKTTQPNLPKVAPNP